MKMVSREIHNAESGCWHVGLSSVTTQKAQWDGPTNYRTWGQPRNPVNLQGIVSPSGYSRSLLISRSIRDFSWEHPFLVAVGWSGFLRVVLLICIDKPVCNYSWHWGGHWEAFTLGEKSQSRFWGEFQSSAPGPITHCATSSPWHMGCPLQGQLSWCCERDHGSLWLLWFILPANHLLTFPLCFFVPCSYSMYSLSKGQRKSIFQQGRLLPYRLIDMNLSWKSLNESLWLVANGNGCSS